MQCTASSRCVAGLSGCLAVRRFGGISSTCSPARIVAGANSKRPVHVYQYAVEDRPSALQEAENSRLGWSGEGRTRTAVRVEQRERRLLYNTDDSWFRGLWPTELLREQKIVVG